VTEFCGSLCSGTAIVVDETSFLSRSAPKAFYGVIAPSVSQMRATLVMTEAMRQLLHGDSAGQSTERERARQIVAEFQRHGFLSSMPMNGSATEIALNLACARQQVVCITQEQPDSGLSLENLTTFYIDGNGEVLPWPKHPNRSAASPMVRGTQASSHGLCRAEAPLFPMTDAAALRQKTASDAYQATIPSVGETLLTTSGDRVTLVDRLGDGGEGVVYRTDRGDIAKIYHREKLSRLRSEKLEIMVASGFRRDGICWPTSIILSKEMHTIGYRMPSAKGFPIQPTLFQRQLLSKRFPTWTRRELVVCAQSILEKISTVHRNNILIGDINPLNILIASENEVYLIDTDSYQIAGYPCPVGTVNFTAPEIQGKDFSTYLRTQDHENFAIATLLFMILLPGETPYSHQGGEDIITNIKKGLFPYPLKDMRSRGVPIGPWQYMWSHLPFRTKEAFFNCFRRKERLNCEQWQDVIRSYIYALNRGHLDPAGESDKIYPTRPKIVSEHAEKQFGLQPLPRRTTENADAKSKTCTCKDCGLSFEFTERQQKRFAEMGFDSPRRCPSCREQNKHEKNSGIDVRCRRCKKTFRVSPKEQQRNLDENRPMIPDLCFDCARYERENGEWIVCSECKGEFLFSFREQRFFASRGLNYPKRCEEHRRR
jgi:serine/threonine protein kinase